MAREIIGPGVLTCGEVAHVLGVHPSTVTRWATAGLLPCFRTPAGERRYYRREVQNFLNEPTQSASRRVTADHGSQLLRVARYGCQTSPQMDVGPSIEHDRNPSGCS